MTRPDILNRQRVREEIAVCAARLIAEDGIGDFSVAKRKAAKMIGAPEKSLPNNSEVEEALRIYYGLYQSQEHVAHLKYLRAIALDMMNWLSVFNPQLVGLVLSGFASRHTSINLEMFADSPKDVEIFFLNENRPYFMKEKKVILREHMTSIPVYELYSEDVTIELSVYGINDQRNLPRVRSDGTVIERANRVELAALLGVIESHLE